MNNNNENGNNSINVKVDASAKAEITADLTNLIDKSVVPTTKKLGDAFSSLIEHVFGDFIYKGQLLEAQRQHNITCFIESLIDGKDNIPKEFIKDPKLSIVGPALEASKYYMNEELLRDMFANLLTASFDARKESSVHESFIEIIKQLSPKDAEVINLLQDQSQFAIGRVVYEIIEGQTSVKTPFMKKNKLSTIQPGIMIPLPGNHNPTQTQFVLENLQRLGLCKINFENEHFINNYYDRFSGYPFYEELPEFIDYSDTKRGWKTMGKGTLEITSFGYNFIDICIKK